MRQATSMRWFVVQGEPFVHLILEDDADNEIRIVLPPEQLRLMLETCEKERVASH